LKILVVSSVGGHLTEIMQLAPVLRDHEVVLVLNDEAALPDFPFARVYRIVHAERDARVLYNFLECARILRAEDPDVVLSAGAGPAVPMALVARLCTRARIVFVESAAAVQRPTLTGRLLYPIAHRFFYQWPALAGFFPRGEKASIHFG
jgi:UDP-N-acetylglucosamine:LPS N-acetylglucosamine transferase